MFAHHEDLCLDAGKNVGKKGAASEVIDPEIGLTFGQEGEGVIKTSVIVNKKTNGFGKKDVDACHWAFLSAVRQLQDGAREAGASRVVNLVSYYKRREYRSTTEYECHAGAFIVGVTPRGDLAR